MIDGAVSHRAVHIRASNVRASNEQGKKREPRRRYASISGFVALFYYRAKHASPDSRSELGLVPCLYVIRYTAFILYSIGTITPQLG